ncbi:phosphatidic acid phosphatase type 2/haloperoxidase [Podospora aff. communis PSN243]|uniref:Phosphatidic acid phosphatase type 2/haloperoxidase n=1 Tax=Podospora aff. communis PSN243 TaxID=3040156 RepID=A0AAV9GV59_9PEZI|nr:phosphatidic acid phosphatase type 2/haloperoxidase [Podospora aff. communis PSN243]
MIPPLPKTSEPAEHNSNHIMYWNNLALDINRLSHSLPNAPQGGPALSSRVLGILHLAIHDAYFAIHPPADGAFTCYLPELPPLDGVSDARTAVAGAAITVLETLYTTPSPSIATATTFALRQFTADAVAGFPNLDVLLPDYQFGVAIARAVLGLLLYPGEPGAAQGNYRPKDGPYKFRVEPNHPVRLVPNDINNPSGPRHAETPYYAPFYGTATRRVAVQMKVNGEDTDHVIADPPTGFGRNDVVEDIDSLLDGIRSGAVPSDPRVRRSPHQHAIGHFFAYDGVNLIGTPPRLYNQILRKLAYERRVAEDITAEANNADFARLFALCNAAMADAGIFSWKEKYAFEFWRPLSGIREHPSGLGDPFFQTVGAPETNRNDTAFKPPFPAYPSGHATFGGAVFQMARLYYKNRDSLDFPLDGPDNIEIEFISDELDGVSRDLREPYDITRPIEQQVGTVRTRFPIKFPSLWSIIFENAISRIYLGVHWRFDAFAAEDVLMRNVDPEPGMSPYMLNPDGSTKYKALDAVRYETKATRFNRGGLFPIGGVPLGMGIATDVWEGNLSPTPAQFQPGPGQTRGYLLLDRVVVIDESL